MAFKKAMEDAGATLLEPIMEVTISAPEQYMGDLMGDLNARRGHVQGMDTEGRSPVNKATVPLSEMLTYASTLKSITGGRGSYHMTMRGYEEVPAHQQQKIVAAHKAAKEGKEPSAH
jgi:elongation factor G